MQLAALTGNRPQIDSGAVEAIGVEVSPDAAMDGELERLVKAFRESEGRDPHPEGDPQFWSAWNTITASYTGEEPAAIPGRGYDPATDWEPVAKAKNAPVWAAGLAARRGETVEEFRERLNKELAGD